MPGRIGEQRIASEAEIHIQRGISGSRLKKSSAVVVMALRRVTSKMPFPARLSSFTRYCTSQGIRERLHVSGDITFCTSSSTSSSARLQTIPAHLVSVVPCRTSHEIREASSLLLIVSLHAGHVASMSTMIVSRRHQP